MTGIETGDFLMIENTKCDCGHNNPVGTVLCEYCGKPLQEEFDLPKEMRYEGRARRSQRATPSLVDQIWNFFSSVKVAIIIIFITLVAAGIGTIFPQEKFIPSETPETYYREEYGVLGDWFYRLGFSTMYDSWWFFLLLAMIGISLVVCSLDRIIPLYKGLKNQRVVKSTTFIEKQRLSHQEEVKEEEKEQQLQHWVETLAKHHYHVRREEDSLLAEKGRFSRWGPYINHIGLILFLLAALFRWIPGWSVEEFIWLREGEIKRIPESHYYVKNEKAIMEFYDQKQLPKSIQGNGTVVKKYQTNAVLYERDEKSGQLKEVHRDSILVNHPLQYQGYELFQSSMVPELHYLSLKVLEKKSKKELGRFKVNLYQMSPKDIYQVGQHVEVRVSEYYPDFALDENNQPITKSQEPNQPAFIFETRKKGTNNWERSWVIAGQDLDHLTKENQYDIDLAGFEVKNKTGLMVRTDKTLPFLILGAFISMIGLVMGFYWQHRRVWIRWKEGVMFIGAHTNKNWFSLRYELKKMIQSTDMRDDWLGIRGKNEWKK